MAARLCTVGALAAALGLAACGGGSSDSGRSVADVRSCLENAGYGVTTLPSSDVKQGAAHNRGPGQTGELLIGQNGKQPHPEADEAIAVVAFWDTAAHAGKAPGTEETNPVYHVEAIGKTTVQGTTQLALKASSDAKTQADAKAAFNAELKKIERCA